jgi:hypothetical protein
VQRAVALVHRGGRRRQLKLHGRVLRYAHGRGTRALHALDACDECLDPAVAVLALRLRAQLGELRLEALDRPVRRIDPHLKILDRDVGRDDRPERPEPAHRQLNVLPRDP